MPELVGFQTMVILDPYGITFNAVGVFGLDFQLLFKSGSSYCGLGAIQYLRGQDEGAGRGSKNVCLF